MKSFYPSNAKPRVQPAILNHIRSFDPVTWDHPQPSEADYRQFEGWIAATYGQYVLDVYREEYR